jgi:hypothetical protein
MRGRGSWAAVTPSAVAQGPMPEFSGARRCAAWVAHHVGPDPREALAAWS